MSATWRQLFHSRHRHVPIVLPLPPPFQLIAGPPHEVRLSRDIPQRCAVFLCPCSRTRTTPCHSAQDTVPRRSRLASTHIPPPTYTIRPSYDDARFVMYARPVSQSGGRKFAGRAFRGWRRERVGRWYTGIQAGRSEWRSTYPLSHFRHLHWTERIETIAELFVRQVFRLAPEAEVPPVSLSPACRSYVKVLTVTLPDADHHHPRPPWRLRELVLGRRDPTAAWRRSRSSLAASGKCPLPNALTPRTLLTGASPPPVFSSPPAPHSTLRAAQPTAPR